MLPTTNSSQTEMIIVYDGDCPFCRNYVSLMKLRAAIGKVRLVNARDDGGVVLLLAERGFDINEGMAVIYGDTIHFGEDAVTLISSITNSRTPIGRLIARVLISKKRASALYPIMKAGRRLTLKALGILPIRSSGDGNSHPQGDLFK
jgi:predicted DCC family thiol-disulfide oxidoreductase YuxK